MIAHGLQGRHIWETHRQIGSLEESLEKAKKLNKSNSENVIDFLEASAHIGDVTAKKLLAAHQASLNAETPKALPPKQVPAPAPQWLHNTEVTTPPEEYWKIFLCDMERETNDEDRYPVIRHWLDMKNRFTVTEMNMIIDMFNTPLYRQYARALFVENKEKDEKKV
jgi:hypothetical protein